MAITANQVIDLVLAQGVPFDFSIDVGESPAGMTAHLQVRDRPGGLVFADLTVGEGITLDTDNTSLDCQLSADQIALMALVCVWDCILTPTDDGNPVRLASGTVYVSPQVTI